MDRSGYFSPDPREPSQTACDKPGETPPEQPAPTDTPQNPTNESAGIPAPPSNYLPGTDCVITAGCGQAGVIVQRCNDKIRGHCSLVCDDAQSTIDRCDSAIKGHVAEYCQQCEDTINKRFAKIENWLVQQVGKVYALLSPLGVTMPTEPELQQVGATGSRPYYPTGTSPETTQQPSEPETNGALPTGYVLPNIVPYQPGLPDSSSPAPYVPLPTERPSNTPNPAAKKCVEIDICPNGIIWWWWQWWRYYWWIFFEWFIVLFWWWWVVWNREHGYIVPPTPTKPPYPKDEPPEPPPPVESVPVMAFPFEELGEE